MRAYFGDVRDRFDEIYRAAASFVRLPNDDLCSGTHVLFNLNLDQQRGVEQFRDLCYAYEESFDWSRLPLVFDTRIPEAVVRWQQGATTIKELPIELALESFLEQCQSLLQRHEG